jgi:hypothetical protein
MVGGYLVNQQSEGEHQSEGSFSMGAGAAEGKLGRYLLPTPSFYILKFVQAAVLAQCESIDLRVSRSETMIRLRGWTGYNPLLELVNGTISPLGGDATARHLFAGLAGLRAQDPLMVTLQWNGHKATLTPESVTVDKDTGPGSQDVVLRACCRRSRQQAQVERECVLARCWPVPIPLTLNGRRIDRDGPPSDSFKPLWNCYLPADFLLGQGTLARTPGTVFLRIGLKRRARVYFIDAGVVIDTREIPFLVPGVTAMIQADHLEKDLSGFRVAESGSCQDALQELEEVAQALRLQVLEQLDQLEAKEAPFSLTGKIRWQKRVSGTAFGIVGGAAALLAWTGDIVLGTFLLGSPLLVCASVASASLTGAPVFEPDEACHEDLREQIRSRLTLNPHRIESVE